MAVLSRNARLLYLLALFQLAGGPLVLGGLLLVSRLMQEKEMSLADSIRLSVGSLQRQRADFSADTPFHEMEVAADLPPAEPRAPSPFKPKECKDKSWTCHDLRLPVWSLPCLLTTELPHRHDPVPPRLAQAPPLPPPRWV